MLTVFGVLAVGVFAAIVVYAVVTRRMLRNIEKHMK